MEPRTANQAFSNWLDRLGQVWMTGDLSVIDELFAPAASYNEDPFAPSLQGVAAIRSYWATMPASHSNVEVVFEPLVVTTAAGVTHWHARFIRIPSNTPAQLDGVLVVTFDADGRCTSLREWWHSDQSPS